MTHILRWMSVVALVLAAAGCRREAPAPAVDAEAPAEQAVVRPVERIPAPLPRVERLVEEPVGPAAAAPREVPIRVVAIMGGSPADVRAGLVSAESGVSRYARIGDVFEGYEVLDIDFTAETVRLRRDGVEYVAGMTRGTAEAPAEMPPAVGDLTVPPEVPVFTPTESERARGIDPNDAATWPPDYRGPGIERAKPAAPPAAYTPTESERARGIDPNDPATWTPGYLGPGIERARPPAAALEATADERARGIDPNDPATWPEGYRGPGIERAAPEAR